MQESENMSGLFFVSRDCTEPRGVMNETTVGLWGLCRDWPQIEKHPFTRLG